MELIEHRCIRCGGSLNQVGDRWKCQYCGSLFDNESTKQNTQTLKAVLDEFKLEAVNNLRRNLYDAITAEHISSNDIKDICSEIKMHLPDDFQANFFAIACGQNDKDIKKAISKIDVVKNYAAMESVIGFLIRSLQPDFHASLSILIEKTYKDRDFHMYEKYETMLADEALKLNEGVYETKLPRDVFVAYSSKDIPVVLELVERLEEQGLQCFMAVRNLRHGKGAVENYNKALEEAMDHCRSFVFVSSLNSRSLGCDALKIEIPYIRERDIENAPAEFRNDYASIPSEYKKPRVEYMIEKSKGFNVADSITNEFFDGYEWAYSPEEVAARVLTQLLNKPKKAPKADPEQVRKKYCVECGSENDGNNEKCKVCNGSVFTSNYEEYIRLKKKREQDAAKEKAAAEARKKEADKNRGSSSAAPSAPRPTPQKTPPPPAKKSSSGGKGVLIAFIAVVAVIGIIIFACNGINGNDPTPDTSRQPDGIYETESGNALADWVAPTIAVENGYIKVNCPSISSKLVFDINGTEYEQQVSDSIRIPDSLEPGEYTIKVKAVHGDSSVADTDFSEPITVTKLGPTGSIRIENGIAVFDAVSGAESYDVYVDGEFCKSVSTTSVDLQEIGLIGKHSISIVSKGSAANVLASSASEGLDYTVLNNELQFASDENIFTWTAVEGATGYELYINGELFRTFGAEERTINILDIYDESGKINVAVRVLGDGSSYISSPMSETVECTFSHKFVLLKTPEDLAKLNNSSENFILINDIDLSSYGDWTPIDGFTGSLFGNGYTIKNLTISASSSNVGFFSVLGGKVDGLKLDNVYITVTGSNENVGAICGKLEGSINNCYASGEISAADSNLVGGLAGFCEIKANISICNLENAVSVVGKDLVGGIFGSYYAGDSTITSFKNSGTITSTGNHVGGIAGYLTAPHFGYNDHSVNISDSSNTGDVTGKQYVGGLFGEITSTLTTSTLSSSSCSADINGDAYVGCIAGKVTNVTISDCSNTGSTLTANKYVLDGDSKHVYAGGIAGYGYIFNNCINEVDINYTAGGSYVGGIAGFANAEANYSSTTLENKAAISGADYVGGIFGYMHTGDTQISEYKNSGTVTTTGNHIGGLVGYLTASYFGYNDHTVSISDSANVGDVTGKQYVGGLFGEISSTLTTSTLSSSSCSADISGDAYIGCIAGKVTNVTISDCSNTGSTLTATKYIPGPEGSKYVYAGGIAGYGYIFNNCINEVAINPTAGGSYVGGIAGFANAEANYSSTALENKADISGTDYVGGIFGYMHTGDTQISEYKNSGTITSTGNYVGGIAGYLTAPHFGYNDHSVNISDSSNTGDIIGKQYVGGLFGIISSSTTKSTLSSSSCSANINGDAYVGCIAGGAINVTISDCSNTGSTLTANSCIFEPSESKVVYAGGIAGYGYIFNNCINEVDINYTAGGSYVGGIAGYAKAEANYSSTTLENKANISGADYVGGIFGYMYTGDTQISEYKNSGTVTATGNHIGGLVGYLTASHFGYNDHTVSISDSANVGDITGKQFVGGMFGKIDSSTTKSTISSSSCSADICGDVYVGCIAGEAINVTISNCKNTGSTLTANKYILDEEGKVVYAGGFAGYGYIFNNCINEVDINYTAGGAYVGGIAGYANAAANYSSTALENKADISGADYVGGIFGYMYTGDTQISEYKNSGTVTATGNHIGGLVGYLTASHFGYNDHSVNISDSSNAGNVTGKQFVGGLFGKAYTSKNSSSIIDSTSTGTIVGSENYGDIAGLLENITIK